MLLNHLILNGKQEHEERLRSSQMNRQVAAFQRQARARSALQRAIEESLRSGFPIEEVQRELSLRLDRAASQ